VAQASAVAEEQEQKRLLKFGDGMLAGIRAGMLLGCFWDVSGMLLGCSWDVHGTRFSLISGSSGPCLGARFANCVVPYGVFQLTVPTRVAGIRSITVQNTVSGGRVSILWQ
jgi:hypothetical protein